MYRNNLTVCLNILSMDIFQSYNVVSSSSFSISPVRYFTPDHLSSQTLTSLFPFSFQERAPTARLGLRSCGPVTRDHRHCIVNTLQSKHHFTSGQSNFSVHHYSTSHTELLNQTTLHPRLGDMTKIIYYDISHFIS